MADNFPPGEAKRRLRKLAPFNVSICSGNSGWLGIPIIYKIFNSRNRPILFTKSIDKTTQTSYNTLATARVLEW